MPFKEFGKNDLFYNRVKTFPACDFIIYDSKVYYNNFKNSDDRSGTNGDLLGVPQGFISLYELNVDRPIDTGGTNQPPAGKSIYPFITKQGSRIAFKTVSTSDFDNSSQFKHGDVIKSKYPLSASIKRIRFAETSEEQTVVANSPRFAGSYTKAKSNKRFLSALRNTFDKHVYLSPHYAYASASVPPGKGPGGPSGPLVDWNKGLQEMSLMEIPSIFYGSSIRKGSVVLQMYKTGSLIAECRDIKKNGELIQVSGSYNAKTDNGKVAGVVLYNEGFMSLTGSWDLTANDAQDKYVGNTDSRGKWLHFGSGANDGESSGKLTQVLFKLRFEGVNYVPTVTMLAHMPKGDYNTSTNPTSFAKDSQAIIAEESSTRYREYTSLKYANLQHGEYLNHTSSYKKQTYVSKIGIYDSQKRLIAIAKLANPVRKTENRDYTFKLKLDL